MEQNINQFLETLEFNPDIINNRSISLTTDSLENIENSILENKEGSEITDIPPVEVTESNIEEASIIPNEISDSEKALMEYEKQNATVFAVQKYRALNDHYNHLNNSALSFQEFQDYVNGLSVQNQTKPSYAIDSFQNRKMLEGLEINNLQFVNNPGVHSYKSADRKIHFAGQEYDYDKIYPVQMQALAKGYYIDEEGLSKPISQMSSFDRIVFRQNEFDGEWYAHKTSWNSLPEENMRSFWGYETYDKGTWGGLIARKTIGGTKNIFDGLGWVTQGVESIFSDSDKGLSNILYSIGKGLEYNTPDEATEGTWAYHAGNVFDGIGQILGTIAIMKFIPPVARAMGSNFENSFKAGLYTSRALMSAGAGGATTKQLIAMGVDPKEAHYYGMGAFLAAWISESIIPGNFLEKSAMRGKINQIAFREAMEDYLVKAGISLSKTSTNASKRIVATNATKNFFSKLSKFPENPFIIPIKMSVEETFEEGLEGAMLMPYNKYVNSIIYNDAKANQDYYKDKYFETTPNGVTIMKDKITGAVKRVSHEDKEIIINTIGRANKILSRDTWLEEGFNPEEAIYAGISSFVTGLFSLPGHYTATKNKQDAKKKNTDLSLIVSYAMNKDNGMSRIAEEMQSMKNMGAFANYENEIDQKYGKGKGKEAVDVMMNQFVNQIQLHIDALNQYGITNKEVIESFEGDIDIFRNTILITSKMAKIQNALTNGIENNVDGELILETDTEETLRERLKGLESEFNYYAVPRNGKKRSDAYNDKIFEVSLVDDYLNNLIRESEINSIGKEAYNSFTHEEMKAFNESLTLKKEQFVNQEGNIKNISSLYKMTQDGKVSFETMADMYKSFANYFYGNPSQNVQSEFAKSFYERMNQKLEAQGVIKDSESYQEIIKDVTSKISNISSKEKSIDIDTFGDVIKEFDSIIKNLSPIQATSYAAKDVNFQQIRNKVTERLENAKNIATSLAGLPNFEAFNNQMILEMEGIDPMFADNARSISKFEETIAGLDNNTFETGEGQGYVDIENLSSQDIAKAFESAVDNPSSMFIIDGVDLSFELMELYERTQGDNVENAEGNKEIAEKIYYNLDVLDDFLNIESNVIPKIENDVKNNEASPNHNTNRTRFTNEQIASIRDSIASEKANLEELIKKLQVATSDKNYGQEKRAIMDIAIDFNIIKLIQSYHTDSDERRDKLIKTFVETNEKITDIVKKLYPSIPFDDKSHGNNPIMYLMEMYVSEDANKLEKREKVLSVINKIENIILTAKAEMSGELKEHIEYLQSKINPKKESINRKADFVGGTVFFYDSKNINQEDALWNAKNFYDSLLEIDTYSIPNSSFKDSIDFTVLSKMNTWHNAGLNGIPSLKKIYDALKVVDENILNHLSGVKAGQSPYLSYAETHEQEEVLVNMIVSTFNDKGSKLIDENLMKNSIYVRGYAGAGKTTVVLSKYIQTINHLINEGNTTKQKVVVKILTPSLNLQQEHKENREMLKLIDSNLEFEYITFSEYQSGTKGINFSEDIVIVDEASMIGKSEDTIDHSVFFPFIQEGLKNSNTKFVFLGDDSQINHVHEDNKNSVPASKYIAKYVEKTIPLTETHRGLVNSINQISNMFRELGGGALSLSNMKPKKFLFNEAYGVDINNTMLAVETKLAEYINNNPTQHGDYNKFSIIAENTQQKEAIIAKYGKSIENNIFLLTYNVNSEKEFLSGLGSEQVFILYDFDSVIDKIHKEKHFNSEQVTKQEYDKVLTAVSRGRHKVILKWDNSLFTSEYNENLKISKQATTADAKMLDYKTSLEKAIIRRNEITKGVKDSTKKQGYKSAGVLNGELLSYKPVDETTLDNATVIAKNIFINNKNKKVSKKLSSIVIGESNNEINKLRTSILRDVTKLSFITDVNERESEISRIKDEIEQLKDALIKEGYKPGVKFADNLLDASLQGPSLYRMGNGNPIIDSELLYTENGIEYLVSPTIMTVVGEVTENGVTKPVVDIYDVVSYTTFNAPTVKTEEMIVKTIKAAIDNGFVVNNVQVSLFVLEDSVNMHKGDFTYGANEISSIISDLNLGIDFTHGFANKEIYFNIEREVFPTREEELLIGTDGKKVNIDKVTMLYDEKDGFKRVFHVNEEGKIVQYTETEYKEKYISLSEQYEKDGLFNGSALIWKKDNSFYSTTNNSIINYSIPQGQVNINQTLSPEKKKEVQDLMYQLITDNTIIEQRFVENVQFRNDEGGFDNHPFAILNVLSDEDIKKILPTITKTTGVESIAFFENGLNILSASGLPEIGYTENVDGKRVNVNVFSENMIKEKFIDYVMNGNEGSKKIIEDRMNFDFKREDGLNTIETNNGTNEEVKNFNIAKLEMFRKAKLNPVQQVSISSSKHYTAFNNMPLSSFMEENSDYEFSEIKTEKKENDTGRKITMVLNKIIDNSSAIKPEPVVLFLRASNILSKGDNVSVISKYLNDMSKELSQLNKDFEADMKVLQKSKTSSTRQYQKLASQYFIKLRDSKAHQFLIYNHVSISNLLSTPELLNNIYDKEKGSMTVHRTIKNNTSLLGNMLSQLSNIAKSTKDENQIRVFQDLINPPYHNAEWDINSLETINGKINKLSLYLKPKGNTNINNNSDNLKIKCKPKKRL